MPLFAVGLAFASGGPDVPPPHRITAWEAPLSPGTTGTRVAMIVETTDGGPATIYVRDAGTWRLAPATWRSGGVAVHVLDLSAPTDTVRFRSPDASRISLVDWDLFTPTAGEPRRSGGLPPPTPGVLPSTLRDIGVISRSDWGADPTTCTSTEDDWYRMAIHHTAGSQTYGGTVQGAVQALQAYSLGTGEYCDIPYQFLVGYDGSLWEGRPYDYTSGATGGGNNDGNIAVSFLGCYHPTSCSTSHSVTDAMMTSGQLLVQTLVGMHAIPSDSDSIRGHRDWPGNSTACPGEWLYDRLDELRAPLGPDYAAALVGLTCAGAGAELSLTTGTTGQCVLTVQNTGQASWTSGTTKLAPLPRDSASPLAASTWIEPARIATVGATVAPGETTAFTFDVYAPSAGDHTLSLTMLQELVTWFGDDGGPADGSIAVVVHVVDPEVPPDSGDPPVDTAPLDTSDPPEPAPTGPTGGPGQLTPLGTVGCGCSSSGSPAAGTALAGLALLAVRRRSRG
jgi:N-acetylmuramoyl-L-alanine amidase